MVDIVDLYYVSWDFRLAVGCGVYMVRVCCLANFGFLDRYYMVLVVALPYGYKLRARISVGRCTLVVWFAGVFRRSRIGC